MRYILIISLHVVLSLGPPGRGVFGETRFSQNLNGTWAFLVSSATDPLAVDSETDWREATVPASWDSPHPVAWYKRGFRLDRSNWPGRVFLKFDQVNYEARLFLNNREVGYHRDGYLPFEVEITDFVLRDAANELDLRVHDETCVMTPDGVLAPLKSLEHERGIVGDVSLHYRPIAYIEDVFIVPSVENGSVRVEIAVDNGGATTKGWIQTRFPEEQNAPELVSSVLVGSGGSALIVMNAPWDEPKLWWPHSPHLINAETALLDEKGNEIDRVITRFGFREFNVAGTRFALNGVPMNLFLSGLHWRPDEWSDPREVYRVAKEANVNILRLHARPRPVEWYDIADEMGMMLIDESAVYGSHGHFRIETEEFWQAAEKHVAGLIKRDRNHPSIVLWSISNEMAWSDPLGICFERLGEIASHVRALDDSRPMMAHGDGDLAGRLEITNWHYVEEYPASYLPNDAFWPERLAEFGSRPDTGEGFLKRPIVFGEFSSLWHGLMDVLAGYAGEDVYAGFWSGSNSPRLRYHGELLEQYVGAYRWCRIGGIGPWTLFETGSIPNAYSRSHSETFEPLKIFVRERTSRFFGGTSTARNVAIFNDTLEAQQFSAEFVLSDREKKIWSSSMNTNLPPAEAAYWNLDVPLPDVERPRHLTAEFRLLAGDEIVDRERSTWSVFPKDFVTDFDPPVPSAAVYEEDERVKTILAGMGVQTSRIEDLYNVNDLRTSTLVIAPHTITVPTGAWQESVAEFAHRGGRVLALQQHVPALWAPEKVLLSTESLHKPIPPYPDDRIDSRNHIRAPYHSLFPFIRSEQLRYWNDDHVVSRHGFWKPSRGYRTLVDMGRRLDQATLLEMPYGRGCIRLCQMDLIRKFDTEPLARLLLYRLLRPSADKPARAGVVVGATDRLTRFLRQQGLKTVREIRHVRRDTVDDLDVLLIDFHSHPTVSSRSLKSFLHKGGTAFVTGIDPDTAPLLQQVADVTVSATDGDHVIKRTNDPLLDGISNSDLRWVHKQSTTEPRVSVQLFRGTLNIPEEVSLTSVPILASIPVSDGRLILDSSLWLEKWETFAKAERLGVTLMLNLGLRVNSPYWDRWHIP